MADYSEFERVSGSVQIVEGGYIYTLVYKDSHGWFVSKPYSTEEEAALALSDALAAAYGVEVS